MKPIHLTKFPTHSTTDPGIFSPKPTKTHTSELTLKLEPQTKKNKQTAKNRLQVGSPNPLKITENPTLESNPGIQS